MATVAIFGGTGFAGGAIRDEALKRGHSVIVVSRSADPADSHPDLEVRRGNIHDAALVGLLADEAHVVAVALPGREIDGEKLISALPSLTAAAARTGSRLGFVGGAGSLCISENGPRLVDTPEFPGPYKNEALSHADVLASLRETSGDADWFYLSPAAEFGSYNPGEPVGTYRVGGDILLTDASGRSYISGADFALAFVDEIEQARHHRERFTVAY
jgi:putative NADH-flavin reductase